MNNSKLLRSFHNYIKNCVIQYATMNLKTESCLLDIGVGRGGDIFKWDKNNIQNAIGIDVNESYILEATNRLTDFLKLNRNYKFYIYSDFSILDKYEFFHIVSCQFALHYFFDTENHLDTLLSTISNKLVKNGYFIGTILDGDVIHEKLNENNLQIQNNSVFIKTNSKIFSNFGKEIQVHLTNTLYFGECSVSHEYIVYKEVLKQKCKDYNMELVEYKNFMNYENRFYTDKNTDEKFCSSLYTSFIFMKV